MKYKVKDLVSFHIVIDESSYATDLYDVEPQCNWFETIVYCKKIYCEIIRVGRIVKAERIDSDGNKTGVIYNIKNGVVQSEVDSFLSMKKEHNLTILAMFDDSGLKTKKDFARIERIQFIRLKSVYFKKRCKTLHPKTLGSYLIWEKKRGIGFGYVSSAVFKCNNWVCTQSNKIIEVGDDYFWEYSLGRKYLDGGVYISENKHHD